MFQFSVVNLSCSRLASRARQILNITLSQNNPLNRFIDLPSFMRTAHRNPTPPNHNPHHLLHNSGRGEIASPSLGLVREVAAIHAVNLEFDN